MRVQAHALTEAARQVRALAHQVRRDAERAARSQHDAAHGIALRVVVGLDHAAAVAQDGILALGDAVRRQPALAFAQAHAAARPVKAHADLGRGLELIVQTGSRWAKGSDGRCWWCSR